MEERTVRGIAIYPDKRVEEVALTGLAEYQSIVKGYIEPVDLKDGSTMFVNEDFLLGQFGPEDFNSIASDVAGLGGRQDLMLNGILGPVVVVGPPDPEGYTTDIGEQARRWIARVAAEATA